MEWAVLREGESQSYGQASASAKAGASDQELEEEEEAQGDDELGDEEDIDMDSWDEESAESEDDSGDDDDSADDAFRFFAPGDLARMASKVESVQRLLPDDVLREITSDLAHPSASLNLSGLWFITPEVHPGLAFAPPSHNTSCGYCGCAFVLSFFPSGLGNACWVESACVATPVGILPLWRGSLSLQTFYSPDGPGMLAHARCPYAGERDNCLFIFWETSSGQLKAIMVSDTVAHEFVGHRADSISDVVAGAMERLAGAQR